MRLSEFARRAIKPIAAASLVATLFVPGLLHAASPGVACDVPLDLLRLTNGLPRLAKKLSIPNEPIVIVAIGSSSTAGAGASSPMASYPNQLGLLLKARFPGHPITMINNGVNGDEITGMLQRFESGVIAAKPDLVLWQLGTNAVLRNERFPDGAALIHVGLEKIRSIGADIVLIDPQYAPKVVAKPEIDHMVELIAEVSKLEDVNLFRRFDVMKRWHDVDHIDYDAFVSPDGIHMNDFGYACMARGLAMVIGEAAQRPVMSAKVISTFVP